MERSTRKTLDRLIPRIQPELEGLSSAACDVFMQRLEAIFPALFDLLLKIYGARVDFFYHLETMLKTTAQYYAARPKDLQRLDAKREADPLWFQSEQMMGAVCYVDLFAGNLAGLPERIPYFKELGITYLHLMPLFKSPATGSDGGYAVSSFREVNPNLGTMKELTASAKEFRKEGISLVLDFVFNHTSDEHEWARQALEGDPDYQDYFLMFPDRTIPDQYQLMLREIFPEQAPGSFSYRPEVDRWIWTTFNAFQWDLNYRNPEVFDAMLGEMLFLANIGVEVLRLDAVAFIWKEMGTTCENLRQAHWIIQAFNALVRIAAPAMVFLSEAIVHPDEVAKYFGQGEKAGYECPLSYNPTLMALLWETLATREVKLLQHSMQKRLAHPDNCVWVNYVRCHDDIGWSFADEDAQELDMNGFDHRQFLNRFYTGEHPGSFATGLMFNYNPVTKDGRICGMLASLGLEHGLKAQEPVEIEHAIRRILLLHAVILSIGGIPLIYLGDEIALMNDYSYQGDPTKALDNRWVHRPFIDPDRLARRQSEDTHEQRVFHELQRLIGIRKATPLFAVSKTRVLETGSEWVFGFTRYRDEQGFLGLFNFSEHEPLVDMAPSVCMALKLTLRDLVTGREVLLNGPYKMEPYQFLWLVD